MYLLGRRILLSNLGRRLLRFPGFLGGAALVSGKLNLTFCSARDFSVDVTLFSVDVNLVSVAVNADFGFLVAALFRISTDSTEDSRGLRP